MFTLGRFGAGGGSQQRQVGEFGNSGARPFEDEDVLEGVREVILSSDNMGDFQIDIIRARRQVVSRHAVAA